MASSLELLYMALRGEENNASRYITMFNDMKLDLSSFTDFKESLKQALLENTEIMGAFSLIEEKGLPVNSYIVASILNIKRGEAIFLLRIMRELGILFEFKTLKIIKSFRDAIFYEVLARGVISYSNIVAKYPDARKYILELWKEGLIRILDFEKEGVTPDMIEDYDKIDLNEITFSQKFVRVWYDELTGREYGRIEIPINAKIVVSDNVLRKG